MAFVSRTHSRGRIDRAGEELINQDIAVPIEDTLAVINNWRSCHSFPLQIIKMTLLKRAKTINPKTLVAQRLKRLQSIFIKLVHNPNMKLSQMQDVGGCRAVMRSINQVDKLVAIYRKSNAKNPHDEHRPIQTNINDYIKEPKPDGYRSVHLIYKYQSKSPKRGAFNGQRIEIQIRSSLQHAWATAVEIAQTFTGQALKPKHKKANKSWLRFFALMGTAIAIRENRTQIPNTPLNRKELIRELKSLLKKEKILESLILWGQTIKHLETVPMSGTTHSFLLRLDPVKHMLWVTSFDKEKLQEAQDQYMQSEKLAAADLRQQVVLVSVDSLNDLRKAYPNYYADTSEFVNAIKYAIT